MSYVQWEQAQGKQKLLKARAMMKAKTKRERKRRAPLASISQGSVNTRTHAPQGTATPQAIKRRRRRETTGPLFPWGASIIRGAIQGLKPALRHSSRQRTVSPRRTNKKNVGCPRATTPARANPRRRFCAAAPYRAHLSSFASSAGDNSVTPLVAVHLFASH